MNTLFEHELVELCKGEHLCISDYEMLGRNSGFYTYVSDAHHSTSWLDHVICSSNMHSAIGGIYVVDKLPSSDHLPLVVTFSMKVVDKARVTNAHVNKGNEACQTTDLSKARRTYSRLCLFTTRLNCCEPIGSRPCSVHCPDYSLTARSRPSDSLNAATWCHHGAIWCLDTHQ